MILGNNANAEKLLFINAAKRSGRRMMITEPGGKNWESRGIAYYHDMKFILIRVY